MSWLMTKKSFLSWTVLWHPAFAQQFIRLVEAIEALVQKTPISFVDHPKTKLLARIQKLILQEIPADPNSREFAQGNTLGKDQRHWRRAKFLRRFVLFFQFSSQKNMIMYSWINDETTVRKEGAATDPCTILKKLLASGNPPSGWDDLLAAPQAMSISGQRETP